MLTKSPESFKFSKREVSKRRNKKQHILRKIKIHPDISCNIIGLFLPPFFKTYISLSFSFVGFKACPVSIKYDYAEI